MPTLLYAQEHGSAMFSLQNYTITHNNSVRR